MKAATTVAPADSVTSGTEGKPTSTKDIEKDKNVKIIDAKRLKISLDDKNSPNDNWIWESSGNEEIARMSKVIWLEVRGEMDVEPTKKYEVMFNVSLNEEQSLTEWEKIPLYVMARRGKKREYSWKKVMISTEDSSHIPEGRGLVIDKVDSSQHCDDEDKKLYFGLYDIWSGRLKKGLAIHHACVREIP